MIYFLTSARVEGEMVGVVAVIARNDVIARNVVTKQSVTKQSNYKPNRPAA